MTKHACLLISVFIFFLSILFLYSEPLPGDDYLHTSGNVILDQDGNEGWLTGINWYGFETHINVAQGLTDRNYKDILNITAELGFNVLRLPLSLDIVYKWSQGTGVIPTDVNTTEPTPEPIPVPLSPYYGQMKLLYKCGEPAIITSQMKPQFTIVNAGNETISTGELTVHYLYTKTGVMQEVFNVDYAPIGTSNITGTFYDGYLEVGFTTGAGTIAPGGETGEIQLRVNQSDHSEYDQSDDYSFDPAKDTYEEWDHMLLFLNDELVWGEPPEGTGEVPTPGPTEIINPTPEPADDSTPEPTGPLPGHMNGDVNSDSKIDIIDALLIAQYYVGMEPADFMVSYADVNSDDKIDIIDALLVAQYYVGIITGF